MKEVFRIIFKKENGYPTSSLTGTSMGLEMSALKPVLPYGNSNTLCYSLGPASSTSFHLEIMGMFILKVRPKCHRAS